MSANPQISRAPPSLTTVEKRVPRENDPLVAVLREPADAVLRVAGRVEALHGDVPELKALAIWRGLGDGLTVLAPDYGELWSSQVAALCTWCYISYLSMPTLWELLKGFRLQASDFRLHDPNDCNDCQNRTRILHLLL